MPTPAFLRANIGPIILLLQAQIVAKTSLDVSHVGVVADDGLDVPTYQGDQDVLIRPMEENKEPGMLEGSGRVDDRRDRKIFIYCRTRLYLDQVDSDLARLSDASLGHLALEDAVANAVEIWAATDANNNILSFPTYVEGPTHPQKLRADPNWVCSTFTATIGYERNLDQSVQ